MNWYYAESGQQRGPVNEDELNQLVARGVIRSETLVWNETLTNWQAWSSVAPSAPVSLAPPEADGRVRCDRCQQLFPPEETLEISGRRVCAACKPLFLQQMREGLLNPTQLATGFGSGSGNLSEAEFLARDYSIDAVSAVSESWELTFRRPGVVWLGSLLLWFVFIATSTAIGFLQLVPILGVLVSAILNGFVAAPMEAGHANLYFRERRGLSNEATSGFAAFGPRFVDVVLTALPQAVFSLAFALVMTFLGLGVMTRGFFPFGAGGPPQFPGSEVWVPAMVVGLVVMLFFIYLYTCLRYAPILALDKGYPWSSAMGLSWRWVRKHFWQNLWLMILSQLVGMAGMMCFCIGALVGIPVAYGMIGVTYDRHFRDLAPMPR